MGMKSSFFAFFAALLLATSVGASAFRLSTGKPVASLSHGAASPAWSQAVGGVLNAYSPAELADMAPSLRTTLPTLGGMNFESAAAQQSMAPVIFNLEKALEIPIEEFEAMSPASRKEAVAMAVEDSVQDARNAAYDLVSEAHQAMFVEQGGVPSKDMLLRMERLQREYGGYLGTLAADALRRSYQAAREREAELRRARIKEAFNETADALPTTADPELLFTSQFSGDAKNFREGDWERLGKEFLKLRGIIRSDMPRKGEIGNVKFLGGPLAGIGEFKFGAGRTHRIYFRYRPEDDAVALLHYAPREHANNPTRVYDKVQRMIQDGVDEAAVPPSNEILDIMASVDEGDLNVFDSDVFQDIPGAEPVKMAEKAPEEGEAPPVPVAAASDESSLLDRAKRFLGKED